MMVGYFCGGYEFINNLLGLIMGIHGRSLEDMGIIIGK
jgi:hypothetical protein